MKLKENIIELRQKGLTVNEIVKQLNCAKSTVSYHINNYGLGGKLSKFIVDIDIDVINKIRLLREEKKTYEEIKKLIDISDDKLKKICRKYNLNSPSNLYVKKEVPVDEIIEYYKRVNSIRITAKFFKLSRETIRQYLPDELVKSNKKTPLIKKKTNVKSVVEWRKRQKIKLVEYKGGCCEICGYNKSIAPLQFHHKNPNEKDFTIGGKSYSFERLKTEVDKCILVCANCHLEIHEDIRLKT